MVFLHPPINAHPPPNGSTENVNGDVPTSSPQSNDGGPVKVKRMHCNERSHDIRMRLYEQCCERSMEKLQSEYLDRRLTIRSKGETDDSHPPQDPSADEDEWQQKRSELEQNLMDIQKQVLPYMKIHMCELTSESIDSLSGTSSAHSDGPLRWSGQCCSFTLWRPTDDHRDLLKPGRGKNKDRQRASVTDTEKRHTSYFGIMCFSLFFVEFIILGCAVHSRYRPPPRSSFRPPLSLNDPSHLTHPHPFFTPASASYLSLATSRMTNIIPFAFRNVKNSSSMPPLSTLPMRTEFMRTPIYLRSNELLSLPPGAEFDCVCLVIWADNGLDPVKPADPSKLAPPSVHTSDGLNLTSPPRWSRTRRLICVGMSGELMVMEVTESDEIIHFTQNILTPQLMIMENVKYNRYERKLRLHTASSTNISRFVSKGVIQLPPSGPISNQSDPLPSFSHAIYEYPLVGAFQSWVAQPTSSLIFDGIQKMSQRMMEHSWDHNQAIVATFSEDDFNHVSTPLAKRTRINC